MYTQPAISESDEQETVVVTASRVDQSIGEVPLSISVIDSAALTELNADHASEALARIPGVALHRGSGAEHLTSIRSPILTGGAGAGAFLYLQNGVAMRSAGFANVNGLLGAHYETADSIEVVRGPSGAAYGANAIHGVINVLTPNPKNNTGNRLKLSGDTQNRYKISGVSNSKIGDDYFSIAASANTEAGYRQDAGLDQQKLTLRHIREGNAVEFDTILTAFNLNQETAGFVFGREAFEDRNLRKQNRFSNAHRDVKGVDLQTNISFDLTENIAAKITPYARWNDMEFLQHFLPSEAVEENSHWSVGTQSTFNYEANKLSLVSGIDFEYTKGELSEIQSKPTIFSFTQGTHYDYEVEAVSLSGFVEGTYELTDKSSVLAAGRVDTIEYNYDNLTDTGIVGRFLRVEDRSDTFTTFSPKLSFLHELSDNYSGYVSYSRGNRPPQTTDLYRLQRNQIENPADAETIDAFEVGLNGRLGSAFNFDVALFHMDKSNFFFRDADGFNVSNGKTRHQGVEFDGSWIISPEFEIEGAVSYAEHTYQFNRLTGNQFETIIKGNEVDTAPKFIGNIRAKWHPIESLALELEWASLDEYFTDAANAHLYEGHDVFNFRAHVDVTDSVKLGLSIRNLTNELYAERADFAFGTERYMPAEERSIGLSLMISDF